MSEATRIKQNKSGKPTEEINKDENWNNYKNLKAKQHGKSTETTSK